MKHLSRGATDGGLPRDAEASFVPDDQIGRLVLVRATVHLRRLVDSANGARASLRVDQFAQPLRDLGPQLLGFLPGIDDSLGELLLDVQEDARQTNGEGARLGPVDTCQVFVVASRIVHLQVTVLLQPPVQVDAAAKRVESVVRQDHQQRIAVLALGHRTPHNCVHAAVQILDHMAIGKRNFLGSSRMLLVQVPPEHVLHPIGTVEHADTQTARDFVQAVKEHRFALNVDVAALLQKMLVTEHVFIESPRVFGESQGGKRSLPFRQIDRIHRRVTDGHRGVLRINVHRSHIQVELRFDTQQQKTADATDVPAQAGPEPDLDPVGVLPATQREFRAVDLQHGAIGILDRDQQGQFQ